LKKLDGLDLDSLFLVVLKENIACLDFKGKSVAPSARDLLASLERRGAEGVNG
jgi:hypothetical protein